MVLSRDVLVRTNKTDKQQDRRPASGTFPPSIEPIIIVAVSTTPKVASFAGAYICLQTARFKLAVLQTTDNKHIISRLIKYDGNARRH